MLIGNFCPNPPKINVRELDEDLDQFARRFRIKEYFHSKKETSEDLSSFPFETLCTRLPHHCVLGGINWRFGFYSIFFKLSISFLQKFGVF
jgi:hypothetical protein